MAQKNVPFKMESDFAPAGDQPEAIAALAEGIANGERFQTLLGITGSGKSATIAWTIEQVQQPTLVLAPNKSLAAQLANEFREFFPENRVEYFVSYYDYYQPEAYIAVERHLHREGLVDQRRDRPAAPLGHRRAAHPARRDRGRLGVVHLRPGLARGVPRATCSCSHGARSYDQRAILRQLVDMQYDRNDMNLGRGKFRVRGDTIEVHPAYDETVVRIEMFGDTVERITMVDPLTGEQLARARRARRLPGHPLRHRRRAHAQGGRRASRPSCRSGWRSSSARASCSRRSGCGCAPSTTSR